jgi:hypothetical protein
MVQEPEVLKEEAPKQLENKNLISIMVLSMSLARAVLGKPARELTSNEGAQVIKVIETTMQEIFPEVAPLILGMYGMELMTVMPILKDPQKLVREMIAQYNVNSDNKLNLG